MGECFSFQGWSLITYSLSFQLENHLSKQKCWNKSNAKNVSRSMDERHFSPPKIFLHHLYSRNHKWQHNLSTLAPRRTLIYQIYQISIGMKDDPASLTRSWQRKIIPSLCFQVRDRSLDSGVVNRDQRERIALIFPSHWELRSPHVRVRGSLILLSYLIRIKSLIFNFITHLEVRASAQIVLAL